MTAEQILEKALLIDKTIAKTTIYRNIEYLLNTKEIARFRINDDSYSYMLNNKHEHFLHCNECGKILPIDDCPIDSLEEKIAKETGFEILNHSIELNGYCKECKKKEKN